MVQEDSRPTCATPVSAGSASRIPLEILCDIIGLAAVHDTSALKTYGFVCRAWLPASRSHLFHNRPISISISRLRTLQPLIHSPHASLASYIRHVVFRWNRLDVEGPPRTPEALHRSFLPAFPSTTTLHLHKGAGISFACMHRAALVAKFPTVTTLSLVECTFDTPDRLLAFLAAFPHLDHLHMKHVAWSNSTLSSTSTAAAAAQGLRFSFRTLDFECGYPLGFMDLLRSIGALPPLQKLRLGGNGTRSWSFDARRRDLGLDRILRDLGPSLQDLDIEVSRIREYTVDLSHNTRLRAIRITHHWMHTSESPISFDWILHFLAGIRSHHIEEVALTIPFPSLRYRIPAEYDLTPSLSRLDHMLNHQPQFRNLRRVRLGGTFQRHGFRIREKMPLCGSRGLLFFQ